MVGVVAVGGGLGALARWLLGPGVAHGAGRLPLDHLLGERRRLRQVIGVFLVLITEVLTAHRLVRPFFGTGVLGGFTTFSTYAVDLQRLFDAGHARTALAYLAATPCAALTAVWLAATATRRVLLRRPR
ncbi:CrcB family protein [Streptomyces longwoodensis]|uniref:fluoride efflux transporter FluC n=1 Tax=Streptomyces longwoodensis TaxID=68231 RepID=UPI002DDBE699|nr:CrcB family protein [Streptomyces longwoodensis]WRY87028.1 CrcB family protein [Streptomyces longwoodensis]